MLDQDGLNTLEDFGGLDGMCAGADFEIDVRSGNTHLAKENVGEGCIVMLAGVDEDRLNLRMPLHFADERGNLWEIGACANDVDNFQAAAHEIVESVKGQQYSI